MSTRLELGKPLDGKRLIDGQGREPGRVVVAITGGSGAGKTTIAEAIKSRYGLNCEVLAVDAYYKHYDFLSTTQRDALDWESIDTIDIALLTDHITALDAGQPVDVPDFDFSVRLRTTQTHVVKPARVLVLEGLFALAVDTIVKTADIRVFVETAEGLRYQRRYDRDVAIRGRSPQSVAKQWATSVQPGHVAVVEPQRTRANLVVDGSLKVYDAVRPIVDRVDRLLRATPVSGPP